MSAQNAEFARLILAYGAAHPDQATAKYFCAPDVNAFFALPVIRAAVDRFIASEAQLKKSYDDIADEIDNSLLVTAVIGGTERRGEYMLNTTGIERAKRLLGMPVGAPRPDESGGPDREGESANVAAARVLADI